MCERFNLIASRISSIVVQSQQNRIDKLRKQSSLNAHAFKHTLFDNVFIKHVQHLFKVIKENKLYFDEPSEKMIDRAYIRKITTLQSMILLKNCKIDVENDPIGFIPFFYALCAFNESLTVKGFGHHMLYMKVLAIFAQQSQPKHRQFIDRGKQLKDLGAFALTQFGHGSAAKQIKTTAKYDHSIKSFIINSNGLQGMKFWIGLAYTTANMAVIWANLIVDGQDYGMHPFVVSLRSLQTAQLYPGITIGDCGPKTGGNSIDNGYLIFENLILPRENLLGKLGTIDKNGHYISKIKSNMHRFGLHLSPLSSGRSLVAQGVLSNSINALTIAIKYCCSRRQFTNPITKQEQLLIDYPTTKYRLMPHLAETIVQLFGNINIAKLYAKNAKILTNSKNNLVQQLHSIAAVLKANATWFVVKVVTDCRQMLGGHGYSYFSRLNEMYHNNDACTTLQGDNNLLLQQTSKFILKSFMKGKKGQLINLQFLASDYQINLPLEFTNQNLQSIQLLKQIFQQKIKDQLSITLSKMTDFKSQDLQQFNIWNKVQPFYCNVLSQLFGDYYHIESAIKGMNSVQDETVRKTICKCIKLWAYNTFQNKLFYDKKFKEVVRKKIVFYCEQVYLDSIKILDATAPPSDIISSPFAKQGSQGMRDYLNYIYSSQNTFERIKWFQDLIKLKQSNI